MKSQGDGSGLAVVLKECEGMSCGEEKEARCHN